MTDFSNLIQYCLLFLAFVVCFCEYTRFFADTPKAVATRLVITTTLLGLCYKAPLINSLSYDTQFCILLFVLFVTFTTAHIIFKRYEHNKFRRMRVLHKQCKRKKNVNTTD